MIDLHSHSSASDGLLSPDALMHYAADKGISVIALTDHDTLAGNQEAEKAAAALKLTFIPGIELNIERSRGEFHLLGYGVALSGSRSASELDALISVLQKGRITRNSEIIERMNQAGLPVSYQELCSLHEENSIGRPHIADYLVQKKIVRNRQQAFDKYLAKGREFYVDRKGADLSEAVSAIKASGGVPVIAHPLSLYVSWGKLESVLQEYFDAGVAGLEAWHPGIRVGEAIRLEELARKIGFFVTAGSDFHGEKIRADRRLGHTAGLRKIEDRFWTDELKPHLMQ